MKPSLKRLAVSLYWIAALSFTSCAEQFLISDALDTEYRTSRIMRSLSSNEATRPSSGHSDVNLPPTTCRRLPVELAPRVHLYAFVTGLQSSLLEHWLRHYLSLGIDLRNRAQIHLHMAAKKSTHEQAELEKSRTLLRKLAGPSSVIEDELWSSNRKTEMANAYIAKLPSNALVIYPDLDEFFEYKCEHLQIVANSLLPVAIKGYMEDRLGKDFKFSQVAEHVPLAWQFPNRCRAIRVCLGSRGDKFTLVPVRDQRKNLIQYRMAHSFNCPGSNLNHVNGSAIYALGGNGCVDIRVLQGPPFPHYHFTEHTARFTKHKLRQYVKDYVMERSQRNMTYQMSKTINSFIKSKKYAMELSLLYSTEGHATHLHAWCRQSCNETIFEIADAATRMTINKTSGSVFADGLQLLSRPASIKSDHKMLIAQAWEARESALQRPVPSKEAN